MKKSILLVVLVLMLGSAVFAQTVATTQIQATKAEALTLALVGVPANFAIVGTTPSAIQDLGITTTWNLKPGRTSVNVCAGMTSAGLISSDTINNTDTIPVSAVLAAVGAGAYAGINAGPGCSAPGSVTVVSSNSVTNATRKNGTKSDTLHLQISGVVATLQADTYTGIITVYALAI